jgi:rod shape-determining protein MreC
MQTLILFLYRIRAFLLFIFLEVVCLWLIFSTQPYQRSGFFNSANRWSGAVMEFSSGVEEYLNLAQQNEVLVQENVRIRAQLQAFQNLQEQAQGTDTLVPAYLPRAVYTFIPAKVINQSQRGMQNYLTINRGRADGIQEDMGVIHSSGIVGKIKAVSERFATVTSLLHVDVLTSARIQRNGSVGTVKWTGGDPSRAMLLYVPRHIEVMVGDTVATSGYSGIYPEGVPIGVVQAVGPGRDATYLDIELRLLTSFSRLSWVQVVGNSLKVEKDSLETLSYPTNE